MTKVLLTGIGGFIGSHTAAWILEHTDWDLIGIDSWKLKHKCDKNRLARLVNNPEYADRLTLHRWDLSEEFSQSFKREFLSKHGSTVDYIINMASDSHVTRSIHKPGNCWLNNCHLIYNMLELGIYLNPRKFIQISTDEVYGDAGWGGPGHAEWSTILPSNPYSASKAAQEALAVSYWRTYNLPLIITNTMNVIGEMQDPEKFLPRVISYMQEGKKLQVHADGGDKIASRVWLDAKNMAAALTFICDNVEPTFLSEGSDRPWKAHIVGETELDVLSLAKLVSSKSGTELNYEIVRGDSVRPGYDRRYALADNNLKATGFKAPFSFDDSLDRILDWYKTNPQWLWVS
jgi:dTDP-glucose 4,6-dehydratase